MTVWNKNGVMGDLCPELTKELGRVIRFYADCGHEDFFITSKCEGTHSPGTFHHIHQAVDFRKQGVLHAQLRVIIGKDFDLVDCGDHFHLEYDPK